MLVSKQGCKLHVVEVNTLKPVLIASSKDVFQVWQYDDVDSLAATVQGLHVTLTGRFPTQSSDSCSPSILATVSLSGKHL